jgi:hypothetical protein
MRVPYFALNHRQEWKPESLYKRVRIKINQSLKPLKVPCSMDHWREEESVAEESVAEESVAEESVAEELNL